jgi:apolipoprotein N-acyltransferase
MACLALSSAVLLFAAFPPLDCWPLAWIAPLGWLSLVQLPQWPAAQAASPRRAARFAQLAQRPYVLLWLSGLLHWLLVLHWLRLPHWATGIGWWVLSAYLACYVPLFVALSRVAVLRWRLTLPLAAPAVWMGLEYARAHLLTGFGMACLGHTQYRWSMLIQAADLGGGYLISGLVMLTAACLALVPSRNGRRLVWRPLLLAAAALAAALLYGRWRLAEPHRDNAPRLRAALVQCSFPTEFQGDSASRDPQQIFERHLQLSLAARRAHPDIDVFLWPESMFGYSLTTHDASPWLPPELPISRPEALQRLRDAEEHFRLAAATAVGLLRAPLLTGVNIEHFAAGGVQRFNSAVLLDQHGHLAARYDKTHPVMFGEYVPLGDVFPWLYQVVPVPGGGITQGTGPRAFAIGSVWLSPSICFESLLPHLIREHVWQLQREGRAAQVLVNLTNDGWFHGSSELHLHLMCGVFRAVECRLPLLVAANTGISAHIDDCGRIVQQAEPLAETVLLADVAPGRGDSLYVAHGDWLGRGALLLCMLAALAGSPTLLRRRGNPAPSAQRHPAG